MTKNNLFKTILTVAAPAIIEMSLNTALMVADTIMVSQIIGKSALSAVGIANSIMFTMIFVFSSFNTGAIALISRSYGERNIDKARDVAHTNMMLNLIIGSLVTLLAYIFKNLLFMPYQIEPAVLADLHVYYDLVMAGMVFQFISFAFAAVSRGVEDTKTPMYITFAAVVMNIVLNYVLIKGIWIFPEMGIGGAALATTLSRIMAAGVYVILFFRGKHKVNLSFTKLKINRAIVGPLWRISYPGAVEQFLMQTAFLIAGIIVTTLDTNAEALFRIITNIESTSFMPAVGISIAAATLVGKSLGEKDADKAYMVGKLAGIMSIAWGLIIGVVFIAFPKFILMAFTSELDIIALGIPVMLVFSFNQPLLNYNIAISGALRGAGDTSIVMRLTSLRLWGIFIPATYVCIVVLRTGVVGLWYAEILSFLVFVAIMFNRFKSRKWASIEF